MYYYSFKRGKYSKIYESERPISIVRNIDGFIHLGLKASQDSTRKSSRRYAKKSRSRLSIKKRKFRKKTIISYGVKDRDILDIALLKAGYVISIDKEGLVDSQDNLVFNVKNYGIDRVSSIIPMEEGLFLHVQVNGEEQRVIELNGNSSLEKIVEFAIATHLPARTLYLWGDIFLSNVFMDCLVAVVGSREIMLRDTVVLGEHYDFRVLNKNPPFVYILSAGSFGYIVQYEIDTEKWRVVESKRIVDVDGIISSFDYI